MYLELQHLNKVFDGKTVVKDLSLSLDEGKLLCILGSSGCGKTTTLNMIGGFLEPTDGKILLDGQDITKLPPERRPVTTVFQSYGLFPHMTVLQNVMYGLKFRKMKKAEAKEKLCNIWSWLIFRILQIEVFTKFPAVSSSVSHWPVHWL